MSKSDLVPNHHAHFGTFSGVSGLMAALSMIVGRAGDAEFAARLAGVGDGDSVLDIGCGPGVAARYAAKLGATVVGIDPAPIMLRVARTLTRRGAPVRFIEGTAEAVPIDECSVSAAWSIATVHHWSDIDGGLAEVRRVLRAGGRFVAIERCTERGAHGHASHGWTDDQAAAFAESCRAHGFVDVRVEHATYGRRATVAIVATAA